VSDLTREYLECIAFLKCQTHIWRAMGQIHNLLQVSLFKACVTCSTIFGKQFLRTCFPSDVYKPPRTTLSFSRQGTNFVIVSILPGACLRAHTPVDPLSCTFRVFRDFSNPTKCTRCLGDVSKAMLSVDVRNIMWRTHSYFAGFIHFVFRLFAKKQQSATNT